MNKQETTQEHINKIIEFRQSIHAHGFGKQSDALSEVLDAICLTGALSSFPILSQSKRFQRQWHSLYKALERGTLDDEWLSRHLAQQVPEQGVQYYSLDGSAWPRPRARTMDDRQYIYHPTAAVNGGSNCIGHPYSLLDWVPEAHRSWSLCMSVKRIPSQMTAGEMGIVQVKELSQNRAALGRILDIVAADGKYGNAKFLRPLQKQRCGIVVRLRKDRVLYQAPQQPKKRKRGHPRVHGKRFAFKEPETWHARAAVISFEHAKLGQVKLERWNNLHGKNDAAVPMDVLRASIHLEREKPPKPIWLAWQPPASMPSNLDVNAQTIWQAYIHRWPVEPGIRFRKQRLGWTTPQFQHKETGDRWRWLVAIPGSSDCGRPALALAKTAAQAEPTACSTGAAADFCTVWLSCSQAKNAWKTARLAQRQAQNTKTALQSGQKATCIGLNRFYSIVKVPFSRPDPASGFFHLSKCERMIGILNWIRMIKKLGGVLQLICHWERIQEGLKKVYLLAEHFLYILANKF